MLYITPNTENHKTISKLKSGAHITVDQLQNVWYLSDVELVLGKIGSNGKFTPVPNKEFTAEMLEAIGKGIDKYNEETLEKKS